MFKLINKLNKKELGLSNIYEHFIAEKKGFLYCTKKEIKRFDVVGNQDAILCDSKNPIFLKKSGDELFIKDNYDTLLIYNMLNNNKNIIYNVGNRLISLVNNNVAIYYSKIENDNYFGIYDFRSGQYNWKLKNIRGLRAIDNFLFNYDNDVIEKFNYESGKSCWNLSLQNLKSLNNNRHFIGIYNYILIIGIGSDWLIGIDTQTGRLLWKHKTIPDFDILDKEKGILHSITSGYVKRDATTGEIIDLFDNRDYFEEEAGIASQRDNYVISGKHLITTDWRKGRIGAFNTETHQFDWIYDEPGVGFPGGLMMEYYDPYLFIMDSRRNLHVFEKE
ncbi:MAG TPA: hypothetical protein ENK91_05370 [Bacteroidetes bacterium]|nr:hypothetical protein [Bacteroidota bacterium]